MNDGIPVFPLPRPRREAMSDPEGLKRIRRRRNLVNNNKKSAFSSGGDEREVRVTTSEPIGLPALPEGNVQSKS